MIGALGFLLGLIVGVLLVVVWACCAAAGDADRRLEKFRAR